MRAIGKYITRLTHGAYRDSASSGNAKFSQALRTSPDRYTSTSLANPYRISLSKDTFDIEKAKEQFVKKGCPSEDAVTLHMQSELPLDMEDKELKKLEARYVRAGNSIDIYSYIVSAGLSILRSTPYQVFSFEGIKACVRVKLDKEREQIMEARESIKKEINARNIRREEYENYKKEMLNKNVE